jgi:pimeloyl-ACP methyl ester carboxylesterase
MSARCLLLFSLWVPALCASADIAPTADTGLHEAVFTEYSPLASNAELARRMLTPLSAAQIPQLLRRAGKGLSEQPINPRDEKFVVYVPAQAPPTGYALLVFVPPWTDARLPPGWSGVLDRYGVIFVSAARSGNDVTPLGRRAPLALTAAQNLMRLYRVDPKRVYISGFSGGSRTALRLALGYPDLFRGALLNAGSDPIGSHEMPLPPKELFERFQSSTRLVYVTGEMDTASLAADDQSAHSMREWCVFDIDTEITHRRGHEAAPPAALSVALHALFNPVESDRHKLAACRAAVEAKLAARFQQVESLITSGKHDSAQKLLHEIDARFGGIAAPRSLDLAQKSDSRPVSAR